jgi:hypothetical protein
MTTVRSSTILAIGYSQFARVLTVIFRHGGEYEYLRVPPETYLALLHAPSPGTFLHFHIKGSHEYRRVA